MNDIPDDLPELVSQILVDENSRPSLDTIVSHPFFRMGYLPEALANNAITSMPIWTLKPPNPATLKRGYTEAWYKQCKASGVGEYASGECFSVVGDSASSSIYRELEGEAEARKMPIVPMPDGAVYNPFVFNNGKGSTGGLEDSGDLKEPPTSSHRIDSSVNTKYNIPGGAEQPPNKRSADVRDLVAPIHSKARRPVSSYAESAKAARRPAALRSNTASNQTHTPTVDPVATKPSSRYQQRIHSQSVVKEPEAGPKPLMVQQRPNRPSRTRSTRTAAHVSSHNNEHAEAGTYEPIQSIQSMSRNVTRAESARLATVAHLQKPAPQVTQQLHNPMLLPPPSTKDDDTELENPTGTDHSGVSIHTDPITLLARTEELRDNIITALASSHNAASALSKYKSSTEHLPFVSRWVDYSKKHGIGYMLADGSVGVILNHTADKPLTHTFIDHGYKYLKATYDSATLKDIPFTFLTQADDGSLGKVPMPEADRKYNTIVWAKFARYMCKHLKEQTSTRKTVVPGEHAITIVRFYQRVGNVGVWGFSNGCFQVRLLQPSLHHILTLPPGTVQLSRPYQIGSLRRR